MPAASRRNRAWQVSTPSRPAICERGVTSFTDEVPQPRGRDLSGQAKPREGTDFFATNVKACKDTGPEVRAVDFRLTGAGGTGQPTLPQTVYPDGFESLRKGCERGWIVFEVPDGSFPTSLQLEYEEKHVRLTWGFEGTG